MSLDARWTSLFCGYFAIQFILRLAIGTSLDLDEAEAILASRELALGYGPQPPLYFWMQWGVFQVTGVSLLGLAALKALLLAGTLVALYYALRREVAPMVAGAATLSSGLLPQMIWESQRTLTHTVLATLMTAVALVALLRCLGTGRWRDHAWLGVALGLGILAKLNFLPWAAGLIAAAIILPEWRPKVRPARLVVAGAIAIAIAAPNAAWMARNPDLALQSVRKFGIDEAGGLTAALAGTGSLLAAIVGFFALATLVLGGFAVLRRDRDARTPVSAIARLLALGAVLPLPLLWLGVLATGATNINDRWLLPVCWMLVPAAAIMLWERLTPRARRALLATTAGVWLLAMATLPYASLVDPGYRGSDFGPLAVRLVEVGALDRPLYVAHLNVAGNLINADRRLDPIHVESPGDVPPLNAILVIERDGPEPLDPGLADRAETAFDVVIPRGRRVTMVTVLILDDD